MGSQSAVANTWYEVLNNQTTPDGAAGFRTVKSLVFPSLIAPLHLCLVFPFKRNLWDSFYPIFYFWNLLAATSTTLLFLDLLLWKTEKSSQVGGKKKGESMPLQGRGICRAITKHASLPKFTPLGTSVKNCSSCPALRRCLRAAGVLVKISPGSHQSSSSMKQGVVWLFSPHRDGREGWHQAQSWQMPETLPSTSFHCLRGFWCWGVLLCNLKYILCWPHS